jgi:hypothetical protein
VGGAFLLGFFGPPPFVLRADRLGVEWATPRHYPDGSTVSVYGFRDEAAARGGVAAVLRTFSHEWDQTTSDATRYSRPGDGGRGFILPVGNRVVRVEAANDAAVNARLASLPFVVKNPRRNWVWWLLTEHLTANFWGLGAYLILYAIAMARMAGWAARIEPSSGVLPATAEVLRERLLAVNDLNLPFRMRQDRPGCLVAEWRIADARWVAVFEAGGLKLDYEVHLRFDPTAHRVRSLTVARSLSWGSGAARLGWVFSYFRGIVFFESQRGAAVGLLYKDGNWVVDSCYRYRFRSTELTNPLIEAITKSGWAYAPVVTFFRPLGG